MFDARKLFRLTLTAGLGALSVLGGGGNPECKVDSDCASKGSGLVCTNNKCVAGMGNPDSGPTDAGQTDAGPNDSGQIDSGQVDAGPAPTSLTLAFLADAGFRDPMATAISSDGQTVFFTAIDNTTGNAGVWKVSGASAPTAVSSGAPFVMPSGLAISADNATLYVADVASVGTYADGGASDQGGLWTLPAAGASPNAIAVDLKQPVALTPSADGTNLLVSGKDVSGVAGVFKVSPGGGAPTALAQMGLFDPGEASDNGGSLWVAEHRAPSGYGAIYHFAGGNQTDASPTALRFGFPAGLCSSVDGSAIYTAYQGGIWTQPSTGVGAGMAVGLTGGAVDFPNGLSRARSLNTFAFSNGEGSAGAIEIGQ